MPIKDPDSRREYQRRWLAKRREDYFLEKWCVKCGSIDDLELDHINPEEKVDHRIWSWSEVRRLRELRKCQVLCKICHNIKSGEQTWGAYLTHGTTSMYGKHGCRCESCKKWASDNWQHRVNNGGARKHYHYKLHERYN